MYPKRLDGGDRIFTINIKIKKGFQIKPHKHKSFKKNLQNSRSLVFSRG